jgi:integral membrane protein
MNPIQQLRLTGILEGLSYLFLLGIAMPLKYMAHQPLAVQIGGWFHGLFFILFCLALLQAKLKYKWSLLQSGLAFAAAWIPFGTFVLDRKLKQIEHPGA